MKFITPSKIEGSVPAPPSKSAMVRAVAAALLADGMTEVREAASCDDATCALAVAERLGAGIEEDGRRVTIRGAGRALTRPKDGILHCGESGLSMRMFAPIACLLDREITLIATGSLLGRPMTMVEDLSLLGASCRTDNGRAPLVVRGPIRAGRLHLDGSISSQFLTGLLMALPLCDGGSSISVSGLRSTPYVRMTIRLLEHFGVTIEAGDELGEFFIKGNQAYRPCMYTVEGDWSGASLLLAAGAISGRVTVTGLDHKTAQADRAVLDALAMAGGHIETGPDHVTVEMGTLRPIRFDATDCPDLFPPLVALAANCGGKSTIYGVDRLAFKESDRAAALISEFGKLGVFIERDATKMEVHGGRIRGGVVEPHNDHRIAMACAIAGLTAREGVGIRNWRCVSKSYPGFFSDLERLSAGYEKKRFTEGTTEE